MFEKNPLTSDNERELLEYSDDLESRVKSEFDVLGAHFTNKKTYGYRSGQLALSAEQTFSVKPLTVYLVMTIAPSAATDGHSDLAFFVVSNNGKLFVKKVSDALNRISISSDNIKITGGSYGVYYQIFEF